jgi:hypothetical protein
LKALAQNTKTTFLKYRFLMIKHQLRVALMESFFQQQHNYVLFCKGWAVNDELFCHGTVFSTVSLWSVLIIQEEFF